MFHYWFQHLYREFASLLPLIRETSYFGVFILAIFVAYVIPVPEAVFLLLIGFTAGLGKLHIALVLIVVFAGVLIGDNILYRLSFFGNHLVQRFNRKMRESKLIQYEHLVVDHIAEAIYFLRFIVGVRFFGPVIAGSLGIPWKKFFTANAMASLIHTVFFVMLGYMSGKKILYVVAEVEIIRHILLFASPFLVAAIVGYYNRQKKKSV